MEEKPKVLLMSHVFTPEIIGSNEMIDKEIRTEICRLWNKLMEISHLSFYEGRFPTIQEIQQLIRDFRPDIIGCHLSHPLSKNMIESSSVFAIATSTSGYDHIERTEDDDILITHTPGVLHITVADYTISLIMANLRNLVDLHNYVWDGNWTSDEKWDLDQSLSSIIDNKIIGIVGLGEIGTEVLKKLYPWGVKFIYYDKNRCRESEENYPKLECKQSIEEVFKEADIVSLHIPLNKYTENIVNKDLLKLMKKDSLLVNTARGGIINFEDLLQLLEVKEIKVNFAFDVFPEEPIRPEVLQRLKTIKREQPEIRMLLLPHNASADADTRGEMIKIFINNIIRLIESNNIADLEDVNIIPEHRIKLSGHPWKIKKYWKQKKKNLTGES